jgi:DNA-directed RNA polymerase beta subunit
MDVSPKQLVSVATALIPFLEHDGANRALMKRHAAPGCAAPARPRRTSVLVSRPARGAGDVLLARDDGTILDVGGDTITVEYGEGGDGAPSRQVPPVEPGHVHQPEAARGAGDTVRKGDAGRRPSTHLGELPGKNLLVASCRGRAATSRTRSSPSGW